jgi:hypothetical protein
MTKAQRYKYETLVRVRDYGTAHATLFPESSAGSKAFARMTALVAALDAHMQDHVVAAAEARKVKSATRAAVFDYMKTVALTGRRVTRSELGPGPFRMPRRRSIRLELSTARAFIAEAEKRQDQFLSFGVPPSFISDFQSTVDDLQAAVDVRNNSKSRRRRATAGIRTTIAEGLELVRDLDATVTIATREDPIAFATWEAARHIDGQPSSPASPGRKPTPAVDTPPAPVAAADAAGSPAATGSTVVLPRAS